MTRKPKEPAPFHVVGGSSDMGPLRAAMSGGSGDTRAKLVASGECEQPATGRDVCIARYKAGEADSA
jgi:hypothetical protein